MFALLEELLSLFSKSFIKKGTNLIGFNKLKNIVETLNKFGAEKDKTRLINELINKRVVGRLDLVKYLKKTNSLSQYKSNKNKDNIKEDISNLFIRNNQNSLSDNIKSYNKDNKDTPINIVVALKSSWVRAGKWIPAYASASGRQVGVMSIWTKTGSKEYIFPNISADNWIEITTEWTSPYGHGAGSFLWDKNLLASSGANIARRFKLAENRFKSSLNERDQYLLNKKKLKGKSYVVKTRNDLAQKDKAGKWKYLTTTKLAQKKTNQYIIKRSK